MKDSLETRLTVYFKARRFPEFLTLAYVMNIRLAMTPNQVVKALKLSMELPVVSVTMRRFRLGTSPMYAMSFATHSVVLYKLKLSERKPPMELFVASVAMKLFPAAAPPVCSFVMQFSMKILRLVTNELTMTMKVLQLLMNELTMTKTVVPQLVALELTITMTMTMTKKLIPKLLQLVAYALILSLLDTRSGWSWLRSRPWREAARLLPRRRPSPWRRTCWWCRWCRWRRVPPRRARRHRCPRRSWVSPRPAGEETSECDGSGLSTPEDWPEWSPGLEAPPTPPARAKTKTVAFDGFDTPETIARPPPWQSGDIPDKIDASRATEHVAAAANSHQFRSPESALPSPAGEFASSSIHDGMLRTVFHLLDRDGDGVISKQDCDDFFKSENAAPLRSLLGIADDSHSSSFSVIAMELEGFCGLLDIETFMSLHAPP